MAKKFKIKGREFRLNNLMKFMIREKGAFLAKSKEQYFYSNGIVILKMNDGRNHIFSTGNKDTLNMDFWFYNTESPAEQEFLFENDFYQREWQQIIIYLADLDGGFFLFADRRMMNRTGVMRRGSTAYDFEKTEKMALNVISAFSTDLADKIVKANFYSDREGNLLEVKS